LAILDLVSGFWGKQMITDFWDARTTLLDIKTLNLVAQFL